MTAALTATFDATNSRVTLAASGLNAATASSVIYRWENGEVQSVPRANLVRGGNVGAVTSATVYDYTFAEGVANVYQIITYNSGGTVLDTVTASTVTPSNSGNTWLKSVYRPYLNRVVTVSEFSESDFSTHGSLFTILGQSNPVAVTDLFGSRSLTLTLVTSTDAERKAVETFLQFGDIVFLQPPNGNGYFDAGFYAVTSVKTSRNGGKASLYRYVDVDLQAVTEPSYLIVGYTSTWAAIVSAFATWTALEAAFASWSAVEAYIASPSDVVVG